MKMNTSMSFTMLLVEVSLMFLFVLNRSVEAAFSGTRGKKCGKCLKKNLSYVAVA